MTKKNIVRFYMINSIGKRLEQYTAKNPQEDLIVNAEIAGEEDQIVSIAINNLFSLI